MHRVSDAIMPNKEKALKMFDMAARQGHIGAMYALAVVHLEGHEHYHSCKLALELFFSVVRKGFSGEITMMGKRLYDKGQLLSSVMFYLEGGYLGLDEGVINAGLLLDRHKLLKKDISVTHLLELNSKETFDDLKSVFSKTNSQIKIMVLEDLEAIAQS